VGGGAFLFKKAVKEAFATHQILEVKEPMFANVRGYQIAGTNYAYTALQAAGRTLRSMQTEGERRMNTARRRQQSRAPAVRDDARGQPAPVRRPDPLQQGARSG
jgi:hypothetical protein